ncbi:Pentatricopeptide repeat [Arabidopsis thaliana x Arabidopsis arenosa]|uniref:Pentatricopeptide repeat n=1 Tax=Arabidopsis thaliana x Arabidopsis arenosa TaxID=1240361 RepID=A0A8T1XIR6_9BRAS|nr:Pentatricopeptide repeat [Arabidopsis thaliana x Arabidopsis arenosa]KAG7530076.1 Pentatricopeptide repeat [Arabidopsis thaliana x Arabidopsis arenosa]KAG7530077.1 Pentatricopeptide repeat [Arabidopsis thaliana x Arabidopsis arenosa]
MGYCERKICGNLRLLSKNSPVSSNTMYSASAISFPTFRLHCSIPTELSSCRPKLSRIRTNPSFGKPVQVPSPKLASFDGGLNEAFQRLDVSGNNSPIEAYAYVLELCGKSRALSQGRQLHCRLFKTFPAFEFDFLAGKLVFMYGKCASLDDAAKVFDEMRDRTAFAWNALIGAYVSNGEPASALSIYRNMRVEGVPLDLYSFPVLLKACGKLRDIRTGSELHCMLVKLGFNSTGFIVNALVSMYAKTDDLIAARRLFDAYQEKGDAVLWNSILSSYSTSGKSLETLQLFREMHMTGPASNSYTIVSALTACEGFSYAKLGKEIHAAVLKSTHSFEVYVCNALIAMYTRCGKMLEAGRILHLMNNADVVTWNSLIKGYVQNLMYKEALQFFCDMIAAGHKPDEVSLTSVIAASGRLSNLLAGMELHAYVIKHGWDSNLLVGNTLIDMYSKCNLTCYMGRAFLMMHEKDLISWTTVIAGYALNDCHVEALELFRDVAKKRMEIDEMMLGSILRACSVLKSMLIVKEIHCHILRKGLLDTVIQNELVDVYGKCRNMGYATRVFESIKGKDVVSWTSMISSSALNGNENEAVELFRRMAETGLSADSVALLCILSAAASLSALKKGREIHGYLLRKGFCLEGSIAVAVVDMYACCGDLQSAKAVFDRIERKGLLQYTSMINAYGMHGCGKASVELFDKMRHENVSPDHISFLALLYACSHAGLLDEGRRFLKIMELEYKLEPWPEHYVCLVDMLGRANCVVEAFEFVKMMKTEPTTEVWCALLAACRSHSEKEIGEIAAQRLLELEPKNPGNLVLVSNVFAEQGRWNDVEKVRAKMKASGMEKQPGCSWIEMDGKVHKFTARDKSHPETKEIYEKLSEVTRKLERESGYLADTKFILHNVDEGEKVQMLHGHSERLAIAYGLLRTPDRACLRITKNLRVCRDCHTFCKLVSKLFRRDIVMRDANRFHHFESGLCSCGDSW